MRKIKIYSTVGVSGTIETDVRTLAELKPLLRQREINYDGMKLLVGDTRNELSIDEAQLPETDFKLYLMPEKTKSGNKGSILETISGLFSDLSDAFQELADAEDDEPSTQSYSSPSATKAVTFEDMEAMDDIKRLNGGF
jgi:hypothetical protein